MEEKTDGLRQEEIERLKALVAEWKGLWRFHAGLARRMTGIVGQDLISHAGSCYFDCAENLEKEIKKLEGLPSAIPLEAQK